MVIKKFLIIFVLFWGFNPLFCAEQNIPTQIQTQFEAKVKAYSPKLQEAARGLLYSLGVISIVLTFGFMAMRGELELGGVAAQLVKYALIIGFFQWLIDSPQYFKSIFGGFDKLGISVGNVSFDTIINKIYGMWDTIYKQSSIWKPAESIIFGIVGIVASFAILSLIGQALMIYAFTIFSIYAGVLWLGFGSFEQTRSWAINAIANVVRWSAKWMMILILMAITFSLVDDALQNVKDITGAITLLIVSVLMVTISSGISGFVDSYFTGSGGGENNRGIQMLQSAMNMAAGAAIGAGLGAAAAISAAKDSGSGGVGQAGAGLGGAFIGAMRGGITGASSMASNKAQGKNVFGEFKDSKNAQKDSGSNSGGSSTTNPYNLKDINTNGWKSDGAAGGGLKGTIAEPKVG